MRNSDWSSDVCSSDLTGVITETLRGSSSRLWDNIMSLWDGIDEFVAVAAAGSFTKGAAALGRSTTHVSRAIMLLEQRLQAQLFRRTTRGVRLTDTRRVFLDHCQRSAAHTSALQSLMPNQ